MRKLRRNTQPNEVRRVVMPSAREARKWRNDVEHDMVISLLEELHDAIAICATSCSLDVSELSTPFIDQLAVALSGLGYEISRGYNGDRRVIRLVVEW